MGLFNDKRKKDESIAPAPPAPARPPPQPQAPRFSIDDAIALMRKLPHDNVELVVKVVRTTLESVSIHVYEIVRAAGQRSTEIETKMNAERARIGELEAEIVSRRAEIQKLQTQFDETEEVKEKLLLADEPEDSVTIVTPPPPPKQAAISG